MELKEFSDGYCLRHKGKDYLYQGKSNSVIDMIAEKVKELLKNDLQLLKNKILKDNHLF